jgi:hypothetical protein
LLFVAANHWLFQFVRFLEAALSSSRLQTEEKDRMRSAIPFPAASQLHHDIEAAELRVFLVGALGLSLREPFLSVRFIIAAAEPYVTFRCLPRSRF